MAKTEGLSATPGLIRLREAQRLQRQRHPERVEARWRLNQAVRDGILTRPTACQDCGGPGEGPRPIQAHHDNYSKPLDVVWVCSKCHVVRDRETKARRDG